MTIHTHRRQLLAAQLTLTSGALCGLAGFTPALAAAPAVQLADPVLFESGEPTAEEQYLLELVNRARADPAAEVTRLGIDLNQGLPPGSITTDPKPPLALQPQLIDAARAHSQWMLDTDTFSHTGVDDTTPGERMTAAGYLFTGSWTWGENIAWKGSTGDLGDLTAATATLHDGWVNSPGHRKNLLNPDFDEIGTGLLTGQFTEASVEYNALMGTQAFARSDGTPGPLLLGVVYDDANDSGSYEPGEGVSGVTVQPTGSNYYAVTASAGGYAVPYNGTGDVTVTFSGAALGTVTRSVAVTGDNVKLDLVLPVASQYRLSVSVAGAGTVTSADDAISCGAAGADCTADYAPDSDVTLIATPDAGYRLINWGGACVGSGSDTCELNLTGSTAVLAQFAPIDDDNAVVDRSGFDWQVTEIYIATLGYAPDNDGLQYWVNNLTTSAWTPTEVAQSFFDNETVQALYPAAQGNELLIDALYHNLFNRVPDAAGKTYWLAQLRSGAISRNQMIIALINGGWANPDAAADMARFGNMIKVGLAFAAAQAERGINYAELNDDQRATLQQFGRQVVATVTADSATRDAAIAGIDALLATL